MSTNSLWDSRFQAGLDKKEKQRLSFYNQYVFRDYDNLTPEIFEQRKAEFWEKYNYRVEPTPGKTVSGARTTFYQSPPPAPLEKMDESEFIPPVPPNPPKAMDESEDMDEGVYFPPIEPGPMEVDLEWEEVTSGEAGFYSKRSKMLHDQDLGFVRYDFTPFDYFWGGLFKKNTFGVQYNHNYKPWINQWDGKKWMW